MAKTSDIDWQLTKDKLTDRGNYILGNRLWSDCKFLVGEIPYQQELAAHKLFLSMASPVFEVMFHGEMAEKSVITVNDIQPDAFKAMLLYVYTDTISLQSFDQACELCYVAKKYMLPKLVKTCTEYLWKDLNQENVCRAFEFGRLFDEPTLQEKSMLFIRQKAKSILQSPRFIDVEFTTLMAILNQDLLNIDSEMDLFNAVYIWVIAECNRKEIQTDDVSSVLSVAKPALQKVRFLSMTINEFSTGPAKSQLLLQSEAFAILMNLCAADNYPMPEGFSTIKTRRYAVVTESSQFSNTYRWHNFQSGTMGQSSLRQSPF